MRKRKNKRKSKSKGFSLVEIIAAIAILAILMLLATSAYNTYKRKARQQAYDTMAISAANATEDYLMENAKEKYITFEKLKDMEYIDSLQDPRYRNEQCTGIVINKVIQGTNKKQLDTLFQKVKLCCKNYKYQYDYTGDDVKITKIENCNYVDGDEIDGVYKLIFKPQGGSTCDPKIITKQEGEEWGPLCITEKSKYVFKGWNTKKNGSGPTITEHTRVGDKDINAYAIWNPIYTLTFNPDKGTECTPSSIEREKGNKWGKLCTTSREGYAFKGWNTKKNGGGTLITSNTYAEKNMTVYAEWNPYYTLTFDSRGGSACDPPSIRKEKGEKWGPLCTPARTGYVFKGWNTKPDGSGSKITEKTVIEKNITAYAIWNPQYTLTYDSNGGTKCNPESITKENNTTWGPLCTTKRTGYKFKGWKDTSGNQVTSTTVCNGNIKVTAEWEASKYTLTYKNGGSKCTTKEGTYDKVWGTLCEPTKEGYNFQGWKDASGNLVTSSTKCKGNLTVEAAWKAKEYTLKYNSNGGSACSEKKGTYGKAWGTLCTTTKTGYKFKGWKNGSTTVNEKTICKGNVKVTAEWEGNKYTLTYDNNGGSGCYTKEVTYGKRYGTLCTPSRTDYSFEGWYTSKSGGTQYTSTTTVSTAKNHTLYAHWKKKQKTKYTANFYLYDYENKITSGYSQSKSCETFDSSCTVTANGINVKTRRNSIIAADSSSYTLSYDRNIEYDWYFPQYYYRTDSGNGLNARECPATYCDIFEGLNVGHYFEPYEFSYSPNSGCANNVWVYGQSYNEGWTGWVCSYYLY